MDSEKEDELNRKKFTLLPSLINMKGLLNHQIASFDHLIDVELKKILLNESNCEIKSGIDPAVFIRYTNIRVENPQAIRMEGRPNRHITPQQCRLRDLTYRGDMLVDVVYTSREKRTQLFTEKDIKIGSIPIMLRSKKCNLYGRQEEELVGMRECPLDPGGYFIIKGIEKVFLVQEQQSKNRVIIEADDHGKITAHVQSKTHYSISKCSIKFKKDSIVLTHRSFTDDIPVVILLKALGLESDQLIAQHIGHGAEFEKVLYPCFEETFKCGVRTQNDALTFIGEKRKDTGWETAAEDLNQRAAQKSKADKAADFLANVLLCHIREGCTSRDWNFRHKALYVCFMIRRMIEASLQTGSVDDRDYYGNKRLETAGTLIGLLFEDLLKQFNRSVKTAMDQQLSKKDTTKAWNIRALLENKHEVIQNGMRTAISSGRWELGRFNMKRAGITQILCRLSYIACLGMMTRLQSAFEKSRKMSGPRALHPSQWGMVCPCDTPEGEKCGLVKNFSLLSQVTLDLEDSSVRSAAYCFGVEEVDCLSPSEFLSYHPVFLNGQLLGIHRYPSRLCRGLRALRRSGRLHPHVSLSLQTLQKCVQIACDGGRIVRLYIVVRDGQIALKSSHLDALRAGHQTINDLLMDGIVEFIDVNEENDCYIAVYPKAVTLETTHLEVEPLSLLGVVAGIIPYPHHNQSARNTFQSAMGKQAIGAIGYNQLMRADTQLNLGVYPQRPMCRSKAMNLTHYEKLGAGINAMVCVMSYSGYDIEDAQVYNRGSLDRGYGRCIVLRKFEVDIMGRTQSSLGDELVPFAKGANGIISKGAKVQHRDILVNKYYTDCHGTKKPAQLKYKYTQPAIVDNVIVAASGDPDRSAEMRIKVITRETRLPEPGDKFSSRHGQKGVVGLITDSVNMPFNEQGITPDMIMNPHGFPSRMTVGKLIEVVSGKVGVLNGKFGDGTAFAGDSVDDIGRALIENGYNYQGKDAFYSGITGEMMQAFVFFGPIYYQRLKHMVTDKMHSRGVGPASKLTRQPVEGRANDGGLRVGEMERDCMVGYGASMLLNERLLRSSDLFVADICRQCGHLGYKNYCPFCHVKGTVSKVNMPYAFKLLIQEMEGMGISTRLILDNVSSGQH